MAKWNGFFLLKTRLIISDSLKSSAVSSALLEEVVSVVDEFLMPGIDFVEELPEKATRAFVGVFCKIFREGFWRRNY